MPNAFLRAAAVALCVAPTTAALPSPLVNGSFDDVSSFLAGWTRLGAGIGQTCTISVVRCAPGGGGEHAVLRFLG